MLDRFEGMIAAGGFASGEQTVVGLWRDSPLGSFVDVMWFRPDGHRVLLAPNEAVADYVSTVYDFDEVRAVAVRGGWTGEAVDVEAGPVHVQLVAGHRNWRSWLFGARPRFLRRQRWWIELEDRLVAPLGDPLLGGAEGVALSGTTSSGRREWYSIDDHRWIVRGRLTVDGDDAGELTELRPGLRVGVSDFPTRPALVNVVTLIESADS